MELNRIIQVGDGFFVVMGYRFPNQTMTRWPSKLTWIVLLCLGAFTALAPAQTLDVIGVNALRAITTNLNGAGIRVAQPEASLTSDLLTWEVNPADVGQSPSLFTYTSADGSTNVYPNALGFVSWHANGVGDAIYGAVNGVATNLARVDTYQADFFITNYVGNQLSIPAVSLVNQSFTFGTETTNLPTPPNQLSVADQRELDAAYDDYAVNFQTLFVSAANNGGTISPPGTAYNCIGVGAFGGSSGVGPTLDNGRSKPDLTAPAGYTSFSTPLVTGCAAVLMQAALRGDGGSDTNSAFDARTIKALLLNGAVKPLDWTNESPAPLDARYGAGVVNLVNAHQQLAGGKFGASFATNIPLASAHPPVGMTNFIGVLSAWDFSTNTSSATNDGVKHYFFVVTNAASAAKFIGTATLVWQRHLGQTNINNLDLFLFNAANSNLVAVSTSRVDNVEHLYLPQLPAGRYDLQVVKNGGTNLVSADEAYALVWEFVAPTLQLTRTGTNGVLNWPAYPAGFLVETRTNLLAGSWQTNGLSAANLTNGQNNIRLNTTNAVQFFRLRRPNF